MYDSFLGVSVFFPFCRNLRLSFVVFTNKKISIINCAVVKVVNTAEMIEFERVLAPISAVRSPHSESADAVIATNQQLP